MTAKPIVADRQPGPGEQAFRARARNKLRVKIALLVFGGAVGGLIGGFNQNAGIGGVGGFANLSLPPWFAAISAALILTGMVALPLYMFGKIDELQVRRNLRGMSAGWFAIMGGYPAWFVLAAGGLAPWPTALGLFALVYVVTLVTFGVLIWRDRVS